MTHGNNQRRGGAGRRVYSHRFSGFKWQRTGTEGICRDPAKVLAAAKTLAYKPNASARKLRTSEVEKPTIAFYWPMDLRINYLAAILTGLRTEIEKLQFDCELIICTYRNDHLAEEQGLKNAYRYSAAIIGAPSEADMAYLQGLKTSLPIILFNRYLEKYHTVCSQDESTLRNAVNLLAAKGHVRACLFHPDALYTVSGKRLFYAPSIRRRDGAFYRKEFHIFRRRQLRWRGNRRPEISQPGSSSQSDFVYVRHHRHRRVFYPQPQRTRDARRCGTDCLRNRRSPTCLTLLILPSLSLKCLPTRWQKTVSISPDRSSRHQIYPFAIDKFRLS